VEFIDDGPEAPFDPSEPEWAYGFELEALPPGSNPLAIFAIIIREDEPGGVREPSIRTSGNLAVWECIGLLRSALADVEARQQFMSMEDFENTDVEDD
jgi:hypothetical protein